MDLNITDVAIIVIILLSGRLSLKRSFTVDAILLVSWVMAFVFAYMFGSVFATFLSKHINGSVEIITGSAKVIIVLATLISGIVLSNIIGKLLKKSVLNGIDKNLGVLSGVARGLLLVLLLVSGINWFGLHQGKNWWRDSLFVPYVLKTEQQILKILDQKTFQKNFFFTNVKMRKSNRCAVLSV